MLLGDQHFLGSPKRILVCGGRDFAWKEILYRILDDFAADCLCVIEGGATGADTLAGGWAVSRGKQLEVYPADWDRYGRSAGPRRNQQMLDEGKPDVVIAFPGGRGTEGMIKLARKAGVRVIEVKMA